MWPCCERRKARRCTRQGAAVHAQNSRECIGYCHNATIRLRARTVMLRDARLMLTHACKAIRSTTSACSHSAMYRPMANAVHVIIDILAMKLRSALSGHAFLKIAASVLFAVRARMSRPQAWGPPGSTPRLRCLPARRTADASLEMQSPPVESVSHRASSRSERYSFG